MHGAEVGTLSQTLRARLRRACAFGLDPLAALSSSHDEAESASAAALIGETLAPLLRSASVPRLAGLADRLGAPGAAFLAVGAGAGGLLVEFCRVWPQLTATGIGAASDTLSLAGEQRVAADDMSGRIRLRCQRVADLRERDAYDLVWLPADCLAHAVLRDAVRRVLARLRTARDGGTPLWPEEAESLLIDAGWNSVHALLGAPIPAIWMTAGRRPSCELARPGCVTRGRLGRSRGEGRRSGGPEDG